MKSLSRGDPVVVRGTVWQQQCETVIIQCEDGSLVAVDESQVWVDS